MAFDYFYGAQSQQFAFYRIPKVLFTDNRFQKISTEGKVLYGLLLDRVSLSMENGWIDDEGRVSSSRRVSHVTLLLMMVT